MRKTKEKLLYIIVPADGKKGVNGGAYCHYFMYTKNHGNFVLKGFWREIAAHIKSSNYGPYFANRHIFRTNMWGHSSDNTWLFWKDDVHILEPEKLYRREKRRNKYITWRKKYTIRNYPTNYEVELKRMPHRWIPEFDKF